MIEDFVLPALTDSAAEITVVCWRKNPGDQVQSGEVLLEIMTEKVNVEVESDIAGVLKEIIRGEGAEVKVGDVLARIETRA